MYYYRSLSDLYKTLENNLYRLPQDIDLIVGIPRSGLLAANILALLLNLPVTDFEGFLQGRIIKSGSTRMTKNELNKKKNSSHPLVIDDSILSGKSFKKIRQQIKTPTHGKVTFAAVYGRFTQHQECDLVFERVPTPRMFQWNYMHHPNLGDCCVDIDGVLCHDPTNQENDDGSNYRNFLLNARPLNIPSYEIGSLVTSRLEKYRPETEKWLCKQGIKFKNLFMLDAKTADERRKNNMHSKFKAHIYKNSHCNLFIESEAKQALEIVEVSKKPVLCTEIQKVFNPNGKSYLLKYKSKATIHTFKQKIKQIFKQVLNNSYK